LFEVQGGACVLLHERARSQFLETHALLQHVGLVRVSVCCPALTL
jgi:hypothetical protein